MKGRCRSYLRRSTDTEGVSAVELALLLPVLLLIVLGIMEFGYDWYLQSVLASAAWDTARYAVRYQVDSGNNHIFPSQKTAANAQGSVSDYGLSILQSQLPSNIYTNNNPTVVPSGTGWDATSTATAYDANGTGYPVTVKVTINKTWNFLGFLMPSLSPSTMATISQTATMNVE
jgi:Flp pilus assembly protein TadG